MVALCSIVYRGRKADMIALISTALTKGECHVIQSPGDADVDNTVERSRHCTTTSVGEDTDLLILLLHDSITDNEIIYFSPVLVHSSFKTNLKRTYHILAKT